jgi:type IX secretion system PorP/SprF family membrane protein
MKSEKLKAKSARARGARGLRPQGYRPHASGAVCRVHQAILALTLLLTLSLASHDAKAQQDAQFSQYMFNPLAYNPAYTGSREALSATLIVRRQWLGFQGGPATGQFNIHSPIANERHGVGFAFTQDQLGVQRSSNIALSYAYRIPVGNGFLNLGLNGGVMLYKTRFSEIVPVDPDPIKPTDDASALLPRVGAGAYFSTPKFFAGVSAPNLMAGRYFGTGNPVAADVASKQSLHLFTMVGAILPLGESVSFRPSGVLKFVPSSPMQVDVNATFFFAKVLGVGVGYRTSDALVFMLEYQSLRRFRAGYAFDLTLSPLRTTTTGSHELMIGLDLGWGKSNFMTPRYF